jgi:hypothetical protein
VSLLLRRAVCLMLISMLTPARVQAADVAFDIRIEKGQVAQKMRQIRLTQGDNVRLRWSSDRPIVVHLHGYDIETHVTPGAIAEMAFTAHAAGRFAVEEHKPDARGGHSHGASSLVRIEVRPR